MIRIGVVVEGSTEAEFVRDVISPQYIDIGSGCSLTTINLKGNVSVDRLTSYMVKIVSSFDAVTSLVDFYGFKGKREMAVAKLEQTVQDRVAARLGNRFDARTVFPYIQVHEFEALLFSDVKPFEHVFDNKCLVGRLQQIRNRFASPEDINDGVDTAPSKRLEAVIPMYRKVLYGAMLADAMGLACIRTQCPRFDGWMTRIDRLAGV